MRNKLELLNSMVDYKLDANWVENLGCEMENIFNFTSSRIKPNQLRKEKIRKVWRKKF